LLFDGSTIVLSAVLLMLRNELKELLFRISLKSGRVLESDGINGFNILSLLTGAKISNLVLETSKLSSFFSLLNSSKLKESFFKLTIFL
jgi:hypothetical protein